MPLVHNQLSSLGLRALAVGQLFFGNPQFLLQAFDLGLCSDGLSLQPGSVCVACDDLGTAGEVADDRSRRRDLRDYVVIDDSLAPLKFDLLLQCLDVRLNLLGRFLDRRDNAKGV